MPPRKPQQSSGPLSPGDTLEFSMTAGVKHDGVDYWIKYGATISVRPGETRAAAEERLDQIVVDGLNAKIEAVFT